MSEIHSRPDHAVYRGRDVRLVSNYPGQPTHESAEDMWESLGWHVDWTSESAGGEVVHPACAIVELDEQTDEEILAETWRYWAVLQCGDEVDRADTEQEAREIADAINSEADEEVGGGAASVVRRWSICREERDAYLSAYAYARQALEDMRGIEASLEAAVEAWGDGDLYYCLEALKEARSAESEYGASPATDALEDDLLEEHEEEEEEEEEEETVAETDEARS